VFSSFHRSRSSAQKLSFHEFASFSVAGSSHTLRQRAAGSRRSPLVALALSFGSSGHPQSRLPCLLFLWDIGPDFHILYIYQHCAAVIPFVRNYPLLRLGNTLAFSLQALFLPVSVTSKLRYVSLPPEARSPVPWPCRLDRLPAKSPPKTAPVSMSTACSACVPDGCCHPSSWRSAHLVHADSPSLYCSLCSSCPYRCVLDLPASVSRFLILSLNPVRNSS